MPLGLGQCVQPPRRPFHARVVCNRGVRPDVFRPLGAEQDNALRVHHQSSLQHQPCKHVSLAQVSLDLVRPAPACLGAIEQCCMERAEFVCKRTMVNPERTARRHASVQYRPLILQRPAIRGPQTLQLGDLAALAADAECADRPTGDRILEHPQQRIVAQVLRLCLVQEPDVDALNPQRSKASLQRLLRLRGGKRRPLCRPVHRSPAAASPRAATG